MDTFISFVIFAIVVIAFLLWFKHISMKKHDIQFKLDNVDQFSISHSFVGEDGNSGIAVDESRGSVCFVFWEQETLDVRILKYNDILSCELYEDGQTVTKTSRSSQIGGALIGGLMLGATGAIIGGLSGKTVSETDKIKRIDLRLVVNDTKKPCHDLSFLSYATKKGGYTYNNAIKQARHWHGLIAVIIKKTDQEDRAENKVFDATQPAISKKQIELDACANCGEMIGRLEKAFVFKENVVCSICNQKLRA